MYNEMITGKPSVKSIAPSSGSTNGGTLLKIGGNGFTSASTVHLDQSACFVRKVETNEIECETQAHPVQTVNVTVMTFGLEHSSDDVSFTFDHRKTPIISQIDPNQEDHSSSVLLLTGENFSLNKNEVHVQINGSECQVITSTLTEITCVLGQHHAGTYPIELKIDSFGFANRNFSFTYNLNIHGLSSTEGSLAGGLHLGINGSGFSAESRVYICDSECTLLNFSSSEIFCSVPSSNFSVDKNCTLEIHENGRSVQTEFSYKQSLTPSVLSSFPKRGGTGGGTILTITGENFLVGSIKVEISDTLCQIITINGTAIVCRTGPFPFSTKKALIRVYFENIGNALNKEHFFEYIDLWSSKYTWGGMDPPSEGEIVVISENQIVYFDTHSPILKGILIIGGALIFDDIQDVHLQCEYIIIV
ncbi:fibrocystin-L isoform X1 [Brachionus plicatilis]|uniref:Fibrocystin-L isoform X1 n=1 Tax=Brachionus plicatilis TaxID=10195 RepID=A0A3M7PNF7_BRAPC|nr:fibrocystin-L isoform X1 [Brachionus plicatilis]